jgi:hypothetical protein
VVLWVYFTDCECTEDKGDGTISRNAFREFHRSGKIALVGQTYILYYITKINKKSHTTKINHYERCYVYLFNITVAFNPGGEVARHGILHNLQQHFVAVGGSNLESVEKLDCIQTKIQYNTIICYIMSVII